MLPPLPVTQAWPGPIQVAYNRLQEQVTHASSVLGEQDQDPQRLYFLADGLEGQGFGILHGLEQSGVDHDFMSTAVEHVATIIVALRALASTNQQAPESAGVNYVNAVHILHTGQRGRPRKLIHPAVLESLLAEDSTISGRRLATLLGVHRNTLGNYKKLYGIRRKFTALNDDQVDNLMRTFRFARPQSGYRYAQAFMRRRKIRIQRRRILASLSRVDQLAYLLRSEEHIKRRRYRVPRSNALWHMDGHHKLIRWGFVIHGFIDGYCRTTMRMLSQLQHGIKGDLSEFHPLLPSEVMQFRTHYGVEGRVQLRKLGQSGAGHPRDEESAPSIAVEDVLAASEDMDLDSELDTTSLDDSSDGMSDIDDPQVEQDIFSGFDAEVRHPSIPVPVATNPFQDQAQEQVWNVFRESLASIIEQGIIPPGYGVRIEEWDDGTYPDLGYIPVGPRGDRRKHVLLPAEVWLPRAQLWAQGLEVLRLVKEQLVVS
ncbi:hypothetical protein FRC01_005288 [Tulasnella sp. 417]|nr:hypothetical protein FRC01_005288 [Tulasnella sp. 417]